MFLGKVGFKFFQETRFTLVSDQPQEWHRIGLSSPVIDSAAFSLKPIPLPLHLLT